MKTIPSIILCAFFAMHAAKADGPTLKIGDKEISDSSTAWNENTYSFSIAQGSAHVRRGDSAWFLYLEDAGIFESPPFLDGQFSISFDGGSSKTGLQVFLSGWNTLASGGINAYNCSLLSIHGPGALSIASANWWARALYSDGALWIGEGAALTIAHSGGGGILAEKSAIYAVKDVSIVGSTICVVQEWSQFAHDQRQAAIDSVEGITIFGSVVALFGGGIWTDEKLIVSHSCVSILGGKMSHGAEIAIDTAIVGIANNDIALDAKRSLEIENTQGAFVAGDRAISADSVSLGSGNTLSIAGSVSVGSGGFVHDGGKTAVLAPGGTAIAVSGGTTGFCMSGGELKIVADPAELDLSKFWKASYLAGAAATVLEQGVSPQAALSALTTFFGSNLIDAYITARIDSISPGKPECGIQSGSIAVKGGETTVQCMTDADAIGYEWSSISKTGGTVTVNGRSWPFAKAGTYKVVFKANGGILPNGKKMTTQTMTSGKTAKLKANKFKRKGWVFLGWSKTKKGPVAYENGAIAKDLAAAGKSVTLYAKWAKKSYKVHFVANGGKGKMSAQKMTYGKKAKLKANKFKRKGYVFKGWAKSKTLAKKGTVAYKDKKSVKNLVANGKTVKLYASWVKKKYRVAFNASGGTGSMSAQTFTYGKAKALYANRFVKPDCLFLGWAESKALADAGRVAYKDGQTVKDLVADGKTVKLYAVWQAPSQYLVIDLSGGSTSSSYPVSRLDAPPAGGFNADEYKTTKLVMRRIDPGTFTMGSPDDEEGREEYREDQHEVSISHAFYIGVFELTQRQWELVMGTRPSYFSNPAYYARRPVEQVSYDMIRGSSSGSGWPESSDVDASSFMGRLRARAAIGGDMVWDLPTEAQWEYACRAGTTGAFNAGGGKMFEVLYANHTGEEMGESWICGELGRCHETVGGDSDFFCTTDNGTAEVGSYEPNNWGLYDMHGNLFEWCLDWWQPHPGTAAVTDPKGPSYGLYTPYRMVRGGSWNDNADCCRSAFRGAFNFPSASNKYIGFRAAIVRPRQDAP